MGGLDEEAIFVFEVGDVTVEVVAAFDADVESTGCGMVGLDELEEPVVFEFDESNPVQFEAGLGFLDHDGDGEFPVGAGDHEDGLHAAADFGVGIMTDEAEVGDGNGCGRELAVVAFDVGVHLSIFGAEDEFALGVEGIGVQELEQGVCGGFGFWGDVGNGSQTGRGTGDAGIGGGAVGATWNLHEIGLGCGWSGKFAGEGRDGRFDNLWSHGTGIGWSRDRGRDSNFRGFFGGRGCRRRRACFDGRLRFCDGFDGWNGGRRACGIAGFGSGIRWGRSDFFGGDDEGGDVLIVEIGEGVFEGEEECRDCTDDEKSGDAQAEKV